MNTLRIKHKKKKGYHILTSPDLAGFLLCGKNLQRLIDDIPESVKLLFKLNHNLDVKSVIVWEYIN